MSHRAAISAHRGGAERHPLGSWEAFQAAVDIGVEYVEFDVRRTRDGALVIYHDHHAERAGLLPYALTRAELARAVGRHIPTLAEILDLVAGRMLAHIDVKEPEYEVEVVTAALDTLGPDGFVITGEDAVVRAAKSADPRVRTALSLGRGPFEIPLSRQVQVRHSELWPLRRVRACGADGVAMHHGLARAGALRTVARAGVPAMIWTVNDARLIRRFLYDPRVAVLVTNYPGLALRERGGPLGHPPGPLGWGNHV